MLLKIYELNYKIELLTGLHIGGSSDVFDIGGADSTVIKNPLNNEPYIPGSSIKGKIRSLLSYRYGTLSNNKLFIGDSDIRNLFEAVEKENHIATSRLIFRDSYLTKESKVLLEKHLGKGVYTEIKAENQIDAIKGTAGNPRSIERVPSGAEFDGQIILQIFEGDNEEKMKQKVLEGLKLLEVNYLGGSGTRGYGRVKINHNGFTTIDE